MLFLPTRVFAGPTLLPFSSVRLLPRAGARARACVRA